MPATGCFCKLKVSNKNTNAPFLIKFAVAAIMTFLHTEGRAVLRAILHLKTDFPENSSTAAEFRRRIIYFLTSLSNAVIKLSYFVKLGGALISNLLLLVTRVLNRAVLRTYPQQIELTVATMKRTPQREAPFLRLLTPNSKAILIEAEVS